MLEHARNALTLLCAAVCIGSALLVVRSCFRSDQAGLTVRQSRLWLVTIDAQLLIAWDPSAVLPASFDTYPAAKLRPALDTVWPNMTGIRALRIGWNMTGAQDERLILPLWLLPLFSAIPPVRWWSMRRRRAARGFAVQPVVAAS